LTRVAIALGSNLGDRRAAIGYAIDRLAAVVSGLTTSDLIETEPEGDGLQDQPLYLNGVAVGETALGARELLERLLTIERDFGRTRPFPGAARTLDLDLILFGDAIVDDGDLQVPHPRFRDRFFVLGPLAEVGPDFVDPLTGLRAGELLRNLLRDEKR
jgi:2-amino-4-hydroxy-6-hydroxymethyldihydropteridine diphosphokinase